ncbi:MAG: hypothetical protein K8G78_07545, partial [Deltaproteobacteria bacterium]|nr:hypothetical protein [Candidatus Kapabacteria bacterium]
AVQEVVMIDRRHGRIRGTRRTAAVPCPGADVAVVEERRVGHVPRAGGRVRAIVDRPRFDEVLFMVAEDHTKRGVV